MSKLKKLIDAIIKDEKMSEREILALMEESIENGDDERCVYKKMYEGCYGPKINKGLAEEWVKGMSIPDTVSDRTSGQKWTMEQTTEVAGKLGCDWHGYDKIDWYCVMNMMYSDYYRTAKAIEHQNDAIFYANMARDWLCDDDAPEGSEKLYRYYFNVVCCN